VTPNRGVSAAGVVTALGLMVAISATASTAVTWTQHGLDHLQLLCSFVLLVAAGSFLRFTLPGDRDAAPIGTAMGLALALVPELGDQRVDYGAWVVIAAVTLGTVVGLAPHAIAARAPRPDVLSRRLLSTATAALLFRSLHVDGAPLASHVVGWHEGRWRVAVLMLVVAVLAAAVDVVLAAIISASQDHAPFRPVLVDEVRAVLGITAAIGATGVLIALAAKPMGLLALPVFAVPLLITQFAFRRYAAVRRTYLQTIRSLSRLTEVGGSTETRHSQRVSELAVEMGHDLGLPEQDLLQLEYAALLHDIGQLSLSDPIPGGATVMVDRDDQRRIAGLGAGIVREAGVLDRVATIVEQQCEPYRLPLQHELAGADDVPLASRIIKVANAYDDLVGDSDQLSRQADALERIHLGLAFEYDPRVVASLTRVLARR
jgi:hypothetical protein